VTRVRSSFDGGALRVLASLRHNPSFTALSILISPQYLSSTLQTPPPVSTTKSYRYVRLLICRVFHRTLWQAASSACSITYPSPPSVTQSARDNVTDLPVPVQISNNTPFNPSQIPSTCLHQTPAANPQNPKTNPTSKSPPPNPGKSTQRPARPTRKTRATSTRRIPCPATLRDLWRRRRRRRLLKINGRMSEVVR